MKIRLSVKQLSDGQWVWCRGASYYTHLVRPTKREALIAGLHEIGCEAQERIDAVDRRLRELGAFDEKDPHGYLA